MANVTQTINNYTGGISQQPDEKKLPGQVVDAVNVLPDVTQGLQKRPGAELVASLSDNGTAALNSQTNGRWFHYYRDEAEQYIGQMSRTGDINMWRCSDGASMTVSSTLPTSSVTGTYSRNTSGVITVTKSNHGFSVNEVVNLDFTSGIAVDGVYKITSVATNTFTVSDSTTSSASGNVTITQQYLMHTEDEDLQTLTLNDFTYITNRTKPTGMAADVEALRPAEAFIDLKKIAYAKQYSLNIYDSTATQRVTTATRIKVDLVASSNNYCKSDGGLPDTRNARYGLAHNTAVGAHASYPYRCDNTTSSDNDALSPNIATEIFNINGGDTLSDVAPSEEFEYTVRILNPSNNRVNADTANPTITWSRASGGVVTVTDTGNHGYTTGDWVEINMAGANGAGANTANCCDGIYQITVTGATTFTFTDYYFTDAQTGICNLSKALSPTDAAIRQDLFFQITNIGQSTPESSSVYKTRYTTTHDLLYGGNGWELNDYFYVWMKGGYYRITVESISESQQQANLGLIRPQPTPFDTETTITAESVIGDIITEIKTKATFTYTQNDGSGGAGTVLKVTHAAHGFQTGDKVTLDFTSGTGVDVTEQAITVNNANEYQYTAGTSLNTSGNVIVNFTDANVQQIGTGIYITRPTVSTISAITRGSFNVAVQGGELMRVITDDVPDIADLPSHCKHGYIVKVQNSDAQEDDHYVRFKGDNDRDGKGSWEECPKPGRQIKFDPAKMPIQLIRNADGTFTVKQITWENCLVGDPITVPKPSFISTVAGTDEDTVTANRYINKMIFWRNRLALLSDENVVLSQPGEFFNFWPKSAIQYTATDNIDISCSSEFPSIIYDGIQANAGLVLFTKNQQFLLTTDSDVLSPQTAKINALASYNFNSKSNPISLGTTVGFLDNAGQHTRFWEMAQILREGEPLVVEQTKVVSKLFDNELNKISNSRENSVVFFSKKNEGTLYGFSYFSTSEKRIQQAWFKWTFSGAIQHHAILDDSLYLIIRDDGKDTMQRIPIKIDTSSKTITDDFDTDDTNDDVTYRVHLDNSKIITASQLGYSADTGRTGFTKPAGFNSTTGQLVVYCHKADSTSSSSQADQDSDLIGNYVLASVVGNPGNYNIEWDGDWTDHDIIVGYLYEMKVKFPTIYYTQTSGENVKADTRASLVVHRLKLNFGAIGLYKTLIERIGKDDYTETWEPLQTDWYRSNQIAINDERTETIPTYEKNKNLSLTLTSKHPAPATLYSMSWEGDYNNKFYKGV